MKVYIDVSNLLTTSFITGIQRVVREVITRIDNENSLELVFVSYDQRKDAFFRINKERFFSSLRGEAFERSVCVTKEKILINSIPKGSIFFDLDGVWHSTKKRGDIYPILANNGVKIVNMIYDVIPITGPIYCHENTVMCFMAYFGAVLQYSSLIIVNAEATKEHIKELTSELNVKMPECTVVPLGADFGGNKKKSESKSAVLGKSTQKAIDAGKYILMVGTIEPRKNHKYLLDALDEGLSVNVVFAGRQGWNVDELVKRIEDHPQKDKRLFWINDAPDADIDELYRNAYFVVFPTKDEGYGLPVIEAIMRGVPVIGSDIPVVREVGRNYISYVDNTKPKALVELLSKIEDDQYQQIIKMLSEYKEYTWDNCSDEISKCLLNIGNEC